MVKRYKAKWGYIASGATKTYPFGFEQDNPNFELLENKIKVKLSVDIRKTLNEVAGKTPGFI